ncbi:hypothetical protein IH992_04725 [Candidatus Poribacteria bacterium]|nr:hypothetical protein [Candidatus Poribacteria bacterium]
MKIEITASYNYEDVCYVRFISKIGHGKGVWKDEPPDLFGKYHVELEIDDCLTWGQDIKEAEIADYRIETKAGATLLCGKIESVFEDGIIGFRLADSLLLIETNGETPEQGEYVEILVNSLSLFNIDV